MFSFWCHIERNGGTDERAIDGSTYNYSAIFTKLRACMVQHNIGKLHV